MKKILFITTNNLSTNPRLLKELKLSAKNGYETSFIAFRLGNWSDSADNKILKSCIDLNAIYLSATKEPYLFWILYSLTWKFVNYLSMVFNKNLAFHAFAHNKRTWQINRYLKKHTGNYDLIIAHNLGALYPAFIKAKKNKIPFAFDIEDYHPGEKCTPSEQKRRVFLMKQILPHAAYLSFASPLIGKYSIDLLSGANKPENFLVTNSFSETDFELIETESDKLRFVWFSQNIAPGRGLEILIKAMSKFKDQVELNLVGNLYPGFYHGFLNCYSGFLQINEPLPQPELHRFICRFDIGLAIELSDVDVNKDIALSNKIFTYAQAGLYLFATDTEAQKQFIGQHSHLGILSAQNQEEMEKGISTLIENIKTIRSQKKNRFEYAKKLAWETEEKKLTQTWHKILNHISS